MADTAAFNVARATLEKQLIGLANYVNMIALGDEIVVLASGFPFYHTGRTPDFVPPAPPTKMVLRRGAKPGVILKRSLSQRTPSMNEVQTCTSDPNLEANWKTVGMFSGGKAILTGYTPGTTVWVRERTAGLRGIMGAWGVPANIMVV